MLNIGMTKLQLDDAVGGEEITLDGEINKDDHTAKEVKKSLLTTLRNKFEADTGPVKVGQGEDTAMVKESGDEVKEIKKARGSIAVKEE